MNVLLVVPDPWFQDLKNGKTKTEACLGSLEKYKHLYEIAISNGHEEIILPIKSITWHNESLADNWQSFLWSKQKIQKKGGIVLFEFF